MAGRSDAETKALLLALRIYDWPKAKFEALRSLLTASDPQALREAVAAFDHGADAAENPRL